MNILKIHSIWEVSIGTIQNIYHLNELLTYWNPENYERTLADYAHFYFLESLWNEPRLSLKNLLIK